MSSTTSQPQRRKLSTATGEKAEAAAVTTGNGSTAPAKAEPAAAPVQDAEETISETDNPAAIQSSQEEEEFVVEYNPLADLLRYRNEVEDTGRLLESLVREHWNLPLSRETVYVLGNMKGQYALVLECLNRDITDQRQRD